MPHRFGFDWVKRVTLASALILSAGAAVAQTKIVVGMVAPGPPQWPLYVAEELGFNKQGQIAIDDLSTGATTAQQLAVGTINIAHSGFPDFVRATDQGAPIKIIVITQALPPYTIYAKPHIKKIADLKGKTISIGGVKDVTLIYLKGFLAAANLKSSDVDFVYAKAAGDRFAALAAGGVDAAILNPPTSFRAASMGLSAVGEISDHVKDFPFTVWAVNTEWAQKNRQAVMAFVSGYQQSVTWLYDPANEERAITILMKYAKIDRNDAKSSYDYLITKLHAFSWTGEITAETFEKMKLGLIELGDIKEPAPPLSKFYDPAYVEAGLKKP
jgi:ABC-type nitrate/sulfonate/bicarbonate transport system substrate-binding protein